MIGVAETNPNTENLSFVRQRFRASLEDNEWLLAIRGASTATWGMGSLLRLAQVGNLQAYAFFFGIGIVALIYLTVFR